MAPTTKPSAHQKTQTNTKKTTRRRIVTRSIYKKQQQTKKMMVNEDHNVPKMVKYSSFEDEQPSSSTKNDHGDNKNKSFEKDYDNQSCICLTPKSEKYKIPKISTCPPAPKKPRVTSLNNKNWLVQRRRPISFFAHPDLDQFFMFAMRDHIKV